ncbi:MAG: HU family DNA-binding protein [Bacteroidetes bacterium]|nr:HU family DNA-binding protein [Bacteroidota bacterium]
MKVIKADLVRTVAKESGVEAVEAEVIIEGFLSLVLKHLNQNHVIEIRGFGTFRLEDRKEKKARNPFTNEPLVLPAQKVPVLKFTKEFKKKISEDHQLNG